MDIPLDAPSLREALLALASNTDGMEPDTAAQVHQASQEASIVVAAVTAFNALRALDLAPDDPALAVLAGVARMIADNAWWGLQEDAKAVFKTCMARMAEPEPDGEEAP